MTVTLLEESEFELMASVFTCTVFCELALLLLLLLFMLFIALTTPLNVSNRKVRKLNELKP